MKARGATNAAALLLAFLWASPVQPVLAKDEPTFYVKEFDHYPQNLNYFDQSDVILFQDVSSQNVWRSPDGGSTWSIIDDVPDGKAFALVLHEFDNKRAYILTESTSHWRTEDQGKTWKSFFTDSEFNIFRSQIFNFHASDPDRIIFNGMDCKGIFCDEVAMYTLDGFKTDAKFLRGNTEGCWWAKGSDLFTTGQSDLDKQRIMCILRDTFSPLKQDNRLIISDNYFSALSADGKIQEYEPNLDTDRPVQGIINVASVKKYVLAASASLNTDEMALFVSDDTLNWHRAMFPEDHRLDQEAYTVLESTNYSIQVDVMTTRPSNPMGVMFTSNSNGTFFTRNIEHTNRNMMGHVDFEKIAGIQGIFLVNKVENWEDVEKQFLTEKKIVSEITHDDGRTFNFVQTHDAGSRIHLHSVTQQINAGRVFSSPAPGLVMANGNTGDYLKPYAEAYLYISDDAGMHWLEGPKGPHKYEFGDQGTVLVAIHDSNKVDVGEIKYSLDHGQTWKVQELPNGLKIKPWVLTTTPDSTSLKFLLSGQTGDELNPKFQVISIDFEGLHERTCDKGDMEEWWARVDEDGKPTCLMGHTQKYTRRKKEADCFMKQEFNLVEVQTTNCDCTDDDFECDYNFRRENGECVAVGPIQAPNGACANAKPEDTFMGSSGWRLIPGNTCKRKKGEPQKDDFKEWKCADSHTPPKGPASGEVKSAQHVFENTMKAEVRYLERGETSRSDDETIIARGGGKILITHDGGLTWDAPSALARDFWDFVPHTYFKDMVLFIQRDGTIVYTVNHGQSFDEFKAPTPPDTDIPRSPFAFHPDKKDWIIWVGKKCTSTNENCYPEASLSTDRGDHWQTLKRYVSRCEFTGSTAFNNFRPQDQIICQASTKEDNSRIDNPWQLVAGPANDFDDQGKVVQSDVKDFATMSEFIVVATQNVTKNTLRALASLDGETYAEAQFPYNFEVSEQHAYTVLDSSTHAVNLFVATDLEPDRCSGSILKSNSNGTSYVMSIAGVNCNQDYFVDFEKMLGLEGVEMVNIVANKDKPNDPKKLHSQISHNDGAEWAYLPPPSKDMDGKSTGCSGDGTEKCALHIHGYTERKDHSRTYSSAGAVGLMFAWGNVGEYLGRKDEADTYMTTDAGMTWKQVKKGRWLWQYGDQGSIIALVPLDIKTQTVSYTTDEGDTWTDFKFADKEMMVSDFTTQSSGVSRKFIVWTQDGTSTVASTVDFTGLADRPCLQKDDPSESDYRIWSPSHPLQRDECLFGHVTQYMRKKTDRQCYNGYRIEHVYNSKNCTCSRRDYECDYNFELVGHGACKLVPGFQPMDHSEYCKQNPDQVEYYEPTGYRKIPLSTCVGGVEFDKQSEPHVCPGKEDEFKERHGLSGVGLFFAITIPFAAAGAAGWWVWRNWSGKFGQIRLGDTSGAGFGAGAFDSDSPFVRYPIIALSAAVAVAGAIPLVVAGLWRTGVAALDRLRYGGGGGFSRLGGGSRPFTTRDSFARGRGDYATVDDDEGELLGEDSDEEV
ncbi:Oligoxyloglucan reducing end-specific cellobiohydrolase [Cryphonectria parasitica EP155]|uniref:Vacuolar protein sorting/targeting protein 10 n=1 Tax=Cryphonectria parasitica (strain ATCC 38755 / EP155) TaxID=660469 RepID=A0A9P5CSF5_CRYP1|nr:Oligoxyloglucan reducing end-specific cellobiohydrolase [Cryphonectria parasitica EP155]KAF3769263.1 Oligoxyloglucan reducing end-specific cellobiohydrolase [Cryphonectria parasitica EP155]